MVHTAQATLCLCLPPSLTPPSVHPLRYTFRQGPDGPGYYRHAGAPPASDPREQSLGVLRQAAAAAAAFVRCEADVGTVPGYGFGEVTLTRTRTPTPTPTLTPTLTLTLALALPLTLPLALPLALPSFLPLPLSLTLPLTLTRRGLQLPTRLERSYPRVVQRGYLPTCGQGL